MLNCHVNTESSLIVNVRTLSVVFDLFILFRIALWPSARKKLSPWLFTCAVFIFSAVLAIRISFPFGVLGRVLNSIVTVPDNCIFIYFSSAGQVYCPQKIKPVMRDMRIRMSYLAFCYF